MRKRPSQPFRVPPVRTAGGRCISKVLNRRAWRPARGAFGRRATITTAGTVSRSFFPLDEQLELRDRHWSEAVAQQAVWLYGQVEDDLAEQILQKIGGIPISDTSIWRCAQKWGEQVRVAEKVRAQAAVGLPQRGQVIRGQVPHGRRMGVAIDGSMLNVRKEGWKELKVGTLFDIAQRTEPDPVTQEPV